MAEKLFGKAPTGSSNTKFVLIRKSDGAYWSTAGTPAFEAYNASNIANYGITATETGATGEWTATNPADTTPTVYRLVVAAGVSLDVTDLDTNVYWESEAGPTIADTTLIEGVDATTQLEASAGNGAGDASETSVQKVLRVVQAQAEQA